MKLNTKFKKMNFHEFTKEYHTNINPSLSLDMIAERLENNEVAWCIISYHKEDVLTDYEDFHNDTGSICELVNVTDNNTDIYIALRY